MKGGTHEPMPLLRSTLSLYPSPPETKRFTTHTGGDMSTKVFHRSGGYTVVPSRWIDSGYMAKAPGSVTQVYLFLCRWANNATLETSQPIKQIARMCGLSEDVARKAVRILEAWGVLERKSETGPHATNIWILNDLEETAPDYPDKVPPKQSRGVVKSGGPESGGPYNATEKKSKSSPNGLREPRKKSTPPHVAIIEAWMAVRGITQFPKGGRIFAAAKELVESGSATDEVAPLYQWLRNKWDRGIEIHLWTLANHYDTWLAAGRPGLERKN